MRLLSFLFILLGLSCLIDNCYGYQQSYDVCVLGGGAGGATAAVFAKKKGYSVLIVERDSKLGGQCDTIRIPKVPGYPNWQELGVQVILDTYAANLILDGSTVNGRWPFDIKAFIEEFVGLGNASTTRFALNEPLNHQYLYEDTNETLYTYTPPALTPEFFDAITRFYAIIAQYPWLDRGNLTGPVPSELLVPFSQFIVTNNLTALVEPLFKFTIETSGYKRFENMITFYALWRNSPTFNLDIGLNVTGGCQSMYDGIANYIGLNNILFNTEASFIRRLNNQSIITLNHNNITCGKLIVAFAQTLDKLKIMDLDSVEKDIFSTISIKGHFAGTVSIRGPIVNTPVYFASRTNSSNLAGFNMTIPPGWVALLKPYPNARTGIIAASEKFIKTETMRSIIRHQLDQLEGPLVRRAELHQLISHEYAPIPTVHALANTTGFFTNLANLQGHRNTYWAGALGSISAHHVVMSNSFDIIKHHF